MLLDTCLVLAAVLSSVAKAFLDPRPDPLADAPTACLQTLNTTYTCDSYIRLLDRTTFYDRRDLDIVCTSACKAALTARRQPIADACGSYAYQNSNGLWYSPIVLVDQTLSTLETVCRKSRYAISTKNLTGHHLLTILKCHSRLLQCLVCLFQRYRCHWTPCFLSTKWNQPVQ
jgi:hypothetical protein